MVDSTLINWNSGPFRLRLCIEDRHLFCFPREKTPQPPNFWSLFVLIFEQQVSCLPTPTVLVLWIFVRLQISPIKKPPWGTKHRSHGACAKHPTTSSGCSEGQSGICGSLLLMAGSGCWSWTRQTFIYIIYIFLYIIYMVIIWLESCCDKGMRDTMMRIAAGSEFFKGSLLNSRFQVPFWQSWKESHATDKVLIKSAWDFTWNHFLLYIQMLHAHIFCIYALQSECILVHRMF